MIKRYNAIEEAIKSVSVPTSMSAVDRALLKELQSFLGAVAEELFEFEGEKYVTLSLVMPKVKMAHFFFGKASVK